MDNYYSILAPNDESELSLLFSYPQAEGFQLQLRLLKANSSGELIHELYLYRSPILYLNAHKEIFLIGRDEQGSLESERTLSIKQGNILIARGFHNIYAEEDTSVYILEESNNKRIVMTRDEGDSGIFYV